MMVDKEIEIHLVYLEDKNGDRIYAYMAMYRPQAKKLFVDIKIKKVDELDKYGVIIHSGYAKPSPAIVKAVNSFL